MLAGHYAVAYGLRGWAPAAPLAALFLAVQAPDILFFVLAPAGVEVARVTPSIRGPLAMELVSMPYTHSLAFTVGWAAVAALAGIQWRGWRVGLALGLAVASHWLLDLVVHQPDLVLTPGSDLRMGWGLWQQPAVAWTVEMALLGGAALWLARRLPSRRDRRWLYAGALLIAVCQTNYMIQPPPATILALAWQAELTYVFLAIVARGVRT